MLALEKEEALPALAEKIERAAGCPVFLMDAHWNILAASPHAPKEDIAKRMKSREYSDFAAYSEAVTRRIEQGGPEPFLIEGKLVGSRRLIVKAYAGGAYVGHLTFLDGAMPIEQLDRELLAVAARVYGVAARLAVPKLEGARPWDVLIADLLEGRFASRVEFDLRMQTTATLYPLGRYAVARVETRGGCLSPHTKRALHGYFEAESHLVGCCSFEDGFVALFDARAEMPTFFTAPGFLELAGKNALFVGYNGPGDDLYRLAYVYAGALRAVRYAKRWNSPSPVQSYDDCRLYDMFTDIRPPTGSLMQYVSHAVTEMMEYDQRHKTQYYETLRVYMRNRMRATSTAEEMFIHKTTLNYRLDKIKELFGVDWEDPIKLLQLLNSLYIIEYLAIEGE